MRNDGGPSIALRVSCTGMTERILNIEQGITNYEIETMKARPFCRLGFSAII